VRNGSTSSGSWFVRRRTLQVAVLVAALVIVACGTQPTGTSSQALAEGAIPWIDQPGQPFDQPTTSPAQRPCHASDLRVTSGHVGAYHGQSTQELILQNQSTAVCFITAPPHAVAVLNDGSQRGVGQGSVASRRINLAPTQVGRWIIGTPADCGPASQSTVASKLVGTLDAGDQFVGQSLWINVGCGSPTTIQFTTDSLVGATSPLAELRPTIVAPASVARGAILTFDVTLSNQTSAAMDLTPCPSYTEQLGPAPVVEKTLLLNCTAVSTIPPGESVTFEMKLPIPATVPTGGMKLSWRLEVPSGHLAGSSIRVG
jgi:hypothetical protein